MTGVHAVQATAAAIADKGPAMKRGNPSTPISPPPTPKVNIPIGSAAKIATNQQTG